jgi:hypothetical protein
MTKPTEESFAQVLPVLGQHLPSLLAAAMELLPRAPHPELSRLGLAEQGGLTRKGTALLGKLRELADIMDLPLA